MAALIAWTDASQPFCMELLSAVGEAMAHSTMLQCDFCDVDNNGHSSMGFTLDDGNQVLEMGFRNDLQGRDLAWVGIHEGYHAWLANGTTLPNEEPTANYNANACTLPAGGGGET